MAKGINMYGNAERRSADPSFTPGPKRQGTPTQDTAIYLSISFLANIILPALIILISGILILYFTRNPHIITHGRGMPFLRSTEKLKLTSEIIRTFVRLTTESLLSSATESEDLAKLKDILAPDLLEQFTERQQALSKKNTNYLQFWEVTEIGRYDDPQYPQYINIAIKGERKFQEKGSLRKPKSVPGFYIARLGQVPFSVRNPWQLVLAKLKEETDVQKIEEIWASARDLAGTPDLLGRRIQAPMENLLPAPLFETHRPYDWLESYGR